MKKSLTTYSTISVSENKMIKLYIAKLKPNEKLHDAALRALDKALWDTFGKRLSDCKIEKTQSGKPFFPDCADIKFNLSHSGEYAAAAVSDREVGVDIERIRPINPRIAERYLQGIVRGSGDADIIEAWCRKESYGKFTGSGLLKADFLQPHFIEIIDCIPGYIIAVCTAERDKTDICII